ncbi:hypothetical protein LYSHEL_25990 [Lysobacter helvus]|uniref:Haem-binding uptake Tiki superfamily ChaN domain-containing protein n=2 Tax=Lysobacteraceae TaxID=32033 RepID=A0ABN6FV44_9GAMM|nr:MULTISPECIES: DUF5694 domain-containing protein [Lysobacter]BCT93574.1 hypothetical protein LYSCAS_25980 [Lysobacter caseinilyticus]BCT96728.1 hypothetical protein LYSHEL_25990 [Lysobacter helvus]
MSARLVVLLVALIAVGSATAQTAPKPAPTKVMIVGTFHLDNPGRDVFNVQVDDVLAKKRQAELADVAASLAKFAPTEVMVEWPSATTDEQYASFRADKLPPSRNEVVQLGFRLAALRKLPRVHGIDAPGEFPFDPVKDYAKTHAMSPRLDAALAGAGKEVQVLSQRVREGSIGSVLRYMNAPPRALKNHGFYMDMLRYGDGDTQPGARLVGAWYARNLAICARLLQALPEGGRAVVFFGEGHAYLLRQCIVETPGVELVEANDYLPK